MRDNMTSNSDGFARHNQLRTVSRTSQGKLSQMFFPPTTNTEATDGKDPMSYRTPHCCSLRSAGGRLSSDIAADHARTMDRVAAALLLVANMINCLLLLYNVSALRSVCTCTMQWRPAPSCSLLMVDGGQLARRKAKKRRRVHDDAGLLSSSLFPSLVMTRSCTPSARIFWCWDKECNPCIGVP